MSYDFETLYPAWGTDAPMWEMLRNSGVHDPDVILFGVAEMKFDIAPEIRAAVQEAALHGTFGYNMPPASVKEAVCGWFQRRHGWSIRPDETIQTYGVVPAIGYAVKAATEPGDGVIVMYPCYGPFERAVNLTGRRLVRSLLQRSGDRWEMDFDALRAAAAAPDVKALILCNPHNPTGRVWTRAELEQLGNICLENGLTVISDEIHCDIVYKPHVHTVFASLSPELAAHTVTLTAPSKTFNIAGMTISNVIVQNPDLFERVRTVVQGDMNIYLNVFGFAALRAAYNECAPWLEEALTVLAGNARFLKTFLSEKLPDAVVFPLEGTYLQWVDFACLGDTDTQREQILKREAKFFSDTGSHYGAEFGAYQRINLACPRHYLQAALDRLDQAVNG